MKRFLLILFLLCFTSDLSQAQSRSLVIFQLDGAMWGYGGGILFQYQFDSLRAITSGVEYKRKSIHYEYNQELEGIHSHEDERYIVDQFGIPVGISYFFSSLQKGGFFKFSVSFDLLSSYNYLHKTVDNWGTHESESDLTSHYDNVEITFEPEIGIVFPLSTSSLQCSLSYSLALFNPYDESYHSNIPISVLRLKFGLDIPF